MNESARLQMLDAIGITPLVPRFVLPGAKPSPQGEVVQLAAQPAIAASVTSSIVPPTSAASLSITIEAVQPVSASAKVSNSAPRVRVDVDVPAARREPEVPVVTQSGAAREPIRLQVSLYQHHQRLYSLLPLYRADFQQEADQFIAAVAKSVGVQTQSIAPQVFRWPYVNNAKLDHGINALRDALAAFVQQTAREPGSVLLLWGAELSGYLPVAAVTAPSEFALGQNLRVIATRRIQDYFNEPQLKRELWRQVCVLKSVFHGE